MNRAKLKKKIQQGSGKSTITVDSSTHAAIDAQQRSEVMRTWGIGNAIGGWFF